MGKAAIRRADALAGGVVVRGRVVSLFALPRWPGHGAATQAPRNQSAAGAMAGEAGVALQAASRIAACAVVRVRAGRSANRHWLAAASHTGAGKRAYGPQRGAVGGAAGART